MVTVDKRKLNPRYYKASGTAHLAHTWTYDLRCQKKDAARLSEWVNKLEGITKEFAFPCHVKLKAMLNPRIGFAVDGSITTFDDASYAGADAVFTKLCDFLRNPPLEAGPFRASFRIEAKTIGIYLNAENRRVPFEELDTEHRTNRLPPKQVTIPSRMLN